MTGERRATKVIRRPSRMMCRELKKRAEIKRLTSFEIIIYERENLELDSLIYFEAVVSIQIRSNVMKFRVLVTV